MLLRELLDVSKRAEQEKTQRSCGQRCDLQHISG